MTHAIPLQSLLETHDQPFVIIGPDLAIQGVNKAYEQYFQRDRSQLIGRPCCAAAGDAGTDETCRHRQLFQDFEPYHLSVTGAGAGGIPRDLRLRGYPLIDTDGVICLGESIVPLTTTPRSTMEKLVGESAAFRAMISHLELSARSDVPVLLTGETGTGKEIAAEFIHVQSSRGEKPLVVMDCTVLTEDLFESEVFGHEKGAFTGATGQKKGLFELADQGTLFLDEVGELPLSQQPKLLRALESGTYRRVGATETRQADVRVIAATHRNLYELVKQGLFREDLYYRLAVYTVPIPPLRERRDDIGLIARVLLDQIGACLGRTYTLAPNALTHLQPYDFPGNIRELRNVLQLAVTMAAGPVIDKNSIILPKLSKEAVGPMEHGSSAERKQTTATNSLQNLEVAYLKEVLRKHEGVRRLAAAEMNISERTLYRKLKRYHLNSR